MLLKTSLLRQFLTLKGYSAISVFLDQSGKYGFKSMQYICQFTSLYFRIIPDEFRCLSGENLLLGVTPENFWKFDTFPGEQSCPHRGTETGCFFFLR